MEPCEAFDYDILVVGAGGAGLRAVIAAREAGCRVGVVCKSLLGKAHTVMAEGGVAAALGNMVSSDGELEPDGWETHFVDTMKGGAFLNNWRMVEIFAHEAIDRVFELEQYGAVFDRTPEGRIAQRPFGGHKYRRLNHVGDRTGLELIRTVQDKAVGAGMDVHMEVTLVRLLTAGGVVVGALGYHRETGRFVTFRAKAVVLATGGWGRMFRFTSNSWEGTGDGVTLAYEAGAELIDMEMMQFHPTGMIWPPGMRGILVTEGVRGEGGILRNSRGERFMFKPEYMPELYRGQFAESEQEAAGWLDDKKRFRRPPELLPRDVVSRAIYREVKAGNGCEHGGVFLDVSQRGAEYIKAKLPSMYDQFHALGDVDITVEPMEVYPTVHYTMGGIRVDPETAAATVPGLFAAGEVAGGLHGANRLGGNSLSDILVFGRRAGDGAAAWAAGKSLAELDPAQIADGQEQMLKPLGKSGGESPYALHAELQETMQQNAMIAREEAGLKIALDKVRELQKRAEGLAAPGGREYNPGWHATRDLVSMLTVSEIIVLCALERKESRGAQWRIDFPERDDAGWGTKNLVVHRRDGQPAVVESPLPAMPEHLKALFQEH
ncbi:MAG: fumarate reductase/succinate dehydrogenase flavoprotein subunit [Armatimonadetes bacterium]|nr:fumarate reductase/succinate dehydrogenase flavoprotein subunit [Armatimonadota bacterium]MDE2205148.1 fumarate reductase/succinate dehydrogenase flavoprotein subunit [Armatimonadota bacterium]